LRIALIVPGTGHFHCGSCLRDDALAGALRELGHDAFVVPLYLPLVLDEAQDAPAHDERVLMGGIRFYLAQKLPTTRFLPRFLERWLDSPRLLRWAARRGDLTDPAMLGPATVGALEADAGAQARSLRELGTWLAEHERPDVLVLNNALLLGLARHLRERLGVPIVCTLQGEAPFLDSLPEPWRERAWSALRERTRDVERFVPVSHDYGERMRARLELAPERLCVVHNGIACDDIEPAPDPDPPSVGYLARLCADKGLPTLVQAFISLARRGRVPDVRLELAGACLRADEPLLREQRALLAAAGLSERVQVHPNLDRPTKLAFLARQSLISVPATYGESFGLYLLEAWAAGLPVVQPRCDSFSELLEASGGGLLCAPDDPEALSCGLEELLLDAERRRALGRSGRRAVEQHFSARRMAEEFASLCERSTVPV